MIAVQCFEGKSVLVFGLGGSGLATVEALIDGGANVLAFDDNKDSCKKAQEKGFNVQDFNQLNFEKFEALILAPGVPFTHPEPHWTVKKARDANIEIIGDVELFNRERLRRAPDCPFIAITGTNGKSTTTALISHILREAGFNVQMGGNIGQAVLTLEEFGEEFCKNQAYVIECSSFQIDLAPTLHPSIGVHLNLSPDHLERHGSFQHYADVKERLILGAERAVIGVDDTLSENIAEKVGAAGIDLKSVSVSRSCDIEVREGILHNEGQKVLDLIGARGLRGKHNHQNAAIAYGVCSYMGLSGALIEKGLKSFKGLAHRMEEVACYDGLLIINDSKATNSDAASRALASFDKIYWILGGLAKQGGIADLAPYFPKVMHAFLIGEAMDAFSKTVSEKIPFSYSQTLEVAVQQAIRKALDDKRAGLWPEDESVAVLLSPACASFDQFQNFEIRGDAFKKAVKAVLKNK